jgi:hypothetical protein
MQLKRSIIVAALAAALLAVSPAGSAPPTPVHVSPASGATFDGVPAMSWNGVAGAFRYEFQLSADAGFNSTQASFFTRNTRATFDEMLTNGTYWWRVRADDGAGSVSAWSTPTSFVLNWGSATTLSAPANAATVVYPTTPLTLKWNAVSRAAEYRLELATDPLLGSSVGSNYPLDTQALEATPPELLAPGTYYWAVTPLDAQGNVGTRSSVSSFTWSWPSTTTPTVTDLSADLEVYDPLFSWERVAGAARYEVEVNSTAAFTSASWVCCSGTTIAISLAPTEVFLDNVYYWRVRALDPSGNAGVWNEGPSFDKRFDKVPPVVAPSVKNLHMRDHLADPGTDVDGVTPGYQTKVPIVTWDPVPGASSYQVDVAPYDTGLGLCDYGASILDRWASLTATNAWSPLGSGSTASPPYPAPLGLTIGKDTAGLDLNQPYCVRVRARSSHVDSVTQWGDYTSLNDGTGPAFTWAGAPSTTPCSPSCLANNLGEDDYLLPIRGTTTGRMPLFTWDPLDAKLSYWVIVAKDSNFTNIVDYAFTQLPAYAVRTGTNVRTYADELTLYYWAVLPAAQSNGGLAASDPLAAAPSNFEKETTPPSLVAPAEGGSVADQPTFQWTAVPGTRYYVLEVAQDPTFSDPIDEVETPATAYSSNSTYPADTVLYWRVRPTDEAQRALTWSATGTFQKTLGAPTLDPANPTSGALIPTVKWSSVPGAVSYDFHLVMPDNVSTRDANGVHARAATLIEMTGTGVFRWQVRANYPSASFSVTHGPWTPLATFTRTIPEPTNASTDAGQNRLLLTWDPRVGAKEYRVQVSARTDFSPYMEQVTTDNTNFASKFVSSAYAAGGTFYWRVAAMDADGNVGDFTGTRTFSMPALTQAATSTPTTTPTTTTTTLKVFGITSKGRLIRRRYRTVTITVKNAANGIVVGNASVRVSGAGLTASTKQTNGSGVVKFTLRPTKLARVTFRVTKSGFTAKNHFKRVWAR